MGPVNWLAVLLGALAFFAVGAIWYGALFGKAWQRELGLSEAELKDGARMPLIFGLCLLLELVISSMFGHLIARTSPPPHVVMMMAFGFGATIIAPAIGINYLYQRKSLKLFMIDAGHFTLGMLALGAVFVLLG